MDRHGTDRSGRRGPAGRGIAALLATLLWAAPGVTRAAPPTGGADQLDVLSAWLRAQAADPGPQSGAAIRARVARGLPPAAAAVLVDALGEHRRRDLLGVLRAFSGHRRPEVRARALAARAELGPADSDAAIAVAADDFVLGVRRLAVVLARRVPSPTADAIVARLLERDPELAAEVARDDAPVVIEPEEPVVIVQDDEPSEDDPGETIVIVQDDEGSP